MVFRRPIDVFIHFEGKRAADVAASRYAVRHLITNEVCFLCPCSYLPENTADGLFGQMEAEKLRRTDSDGTATTAKDILAAYKLCAPHSPSRSTGTDSSRHPRKPDPVSKTELKDAIDFFGRAIAVKPQTAEEAGASFGSSSRFHPNIFAAAPPPPKRVQRAVYRYHEGFSNAVRVTKRVADFLL